MKNYTIFLRAKLPLSCAVSVHASANGTFWQSRLLALPNAVSIRDSSGDALPNFLTSLGKRSAANQQHLLVAMIASQPSDHKDFY